MKNDRSWSSLHVNRDEFHSFERSLRNCDKLSCRGGIFGFHFHEPTMPAHWKDKVGDVLEAIFDSKTGQRAMAWVLVMAVSALILDAIL